MSAALVQALGALCGVAAAATLAAIGTIPGSDALAVISVVVGYFVHASGTVIGSTSVAQTKGPPSAPPAG